MARLTASVPSQGVETSDQKKAQAMKLVRPVRCRCTDLRDVASAKTRYVFCVSTVMPKIR